MWPPCVPLDGPPSSSGAEETPKSMPKRKVGVSDGLLYEVLKLILGEGSNCNRFLLEQLHAGVDWLIYRTTIEFDTILRSKQYIGYSYYFDS